METFHIIKNNRKHRRTAAFNNTRVKTHPAVKVQGSEHAHLIYSGCIVYQYSSVIPSE